MRELIFLAEEPKCERSYSCLQYASVTFCWILAHSVLFIKSRKSFSGSQTWSLTGKQEDKLHNAVGAIERQTREISRRDNYENYEIQRRTNARHSKGNGIDKIGEVAQAACQKVKEKNEFPAQRSQ